MMFECLSDQSMLLEESFGWKSSDENQYKRSEVRLNIARPSRHGYKAGTHKAKARTHQEAEASISKHHEAGSKK